MTSYLPPASVPYSLGTFRAGGVGAPFAGLAAGGRVRVLPEGMTIQSLLERWAEAQDELAALATQQDAQWYAESDVTPDVPWLPGQILQAGANYKKHVVDIIISEIDDEQGTTPEEKRAYGEKLMDERAAHGTPYVFLGTTSAMTGALGDVVLPPREGARDDWELELGVVIGKEGRYVTIADAMDHVAGYTIVNDISSRDRIYRPDVKKIGTDWFAGKNSPTFLPTGPVIVPAQFVPDYKDLRITLIHNGITRQDEDAKDMIFDIPRLIEYASSITVLRPGDLLLTGSPAGNGQHWGVFLSPGDTMDATITGLGEQHNRCIAG